MATSYDTLIECFLPSVSEYGLLELDDQDCRDMLVPYVIAAANKFNSACIEDLNDRDEDLQQFNVDLSDEVIDILVDFMVVAWLKHKLYNSDLLRNGMSTKDYTVFSPANLQNQIRITYQDAREQAQKRLYHYTYTHPNEKISEITL